MFCLLDRSLLFEYNLNSCHKLLLLLCFLCRISRLVILLFRLDMNIFCLLHRKQILDIVGGMLHCRILLVLRNFFHLRLRGIHWSTRMFRQRTRSLCSGRVLCRCTLLRLLLVWCRIFCLAKWLFLEGKCIFCLLPSILLPCNGCCILGLRRFVHFRTPMNIRWGILWGFRTRIFLLLGHNEHQV